MTAQHPPIEPPKPPDTSARDKELNAAGDELYEFMRANDVLGRRYFYPLISSFPMYRGLPSAAPANLPVATALALQVICLPIYPAMTDDDVERVASLFSLSERCALVY